MSYFWTVAAFNNYQVGYNTKYLPGDIFYNVIAIQLANLVANIAAGSVLLLLS